MMRNVCIIIACVCCMVSKPLCQIHFTPYDDLPEIDKTIKPSWTKDAPGWTIGMYQYPTNFFKLQSEYRTYMLSEGNPKNAYVRYYKIWSRAIEHLVDTEGNIHMPDEQTVRSIITRRDNDNSQIGYKVNDNWSFLGPKVTHWLKDHSDDEIPKSCPWQANIYSIDVSDSDPNILYCGTETGIINKSIDYGKSWQIVTQQYQTGGAINAIVIDPTQPDIVYAAGGNQIHKSSNGGISWTRLLTNPIFNPNKLVLDATRPSILFASSDKGIFKTGDSGNTWTKRYDRLVYDVDLHPSEPNRVYGLAKIGNRFGMIQSMNGGDDFEENMNFPTNIPDAEGGVIAVTPADPNIIWALLLSSDDTPLLYKGQWSNNSWSWLQVAKGNSQILEMNNGQGYYDLALEVSPLHPNHILVGTTTLYKTTNGGESFQVVGGYKGNFKIHPDIQDLKFLANGDVWVATDGGISMSKDFFSSENGFSVLVDGLIGSDFWGFDQGWNEDIVVAGRYHNGNTAITDYYGDKALRMGGAESPTGWVIQGKPRHVAFDDLGNGWILPKTAIDKSDGRFPFTKFPNMDEYGGRRSNLIIHPNYSSTMFLGEGNGLWISKDGGLEWTMLYQFPDRVMTIQISTSDPNVFYADIKNHGLHASNDGGKSWSLKPTLTANPYGSNYWKGKMSIAISQSNSKRLYVCLQNGTWSSDLGKVFMSEDGGDTWTNITLGIQVLMKSVITQPYKDGEDLVYLFGKEKSTTEATVFTWTTGDSTWQHFNEKYPKGMNVNHVIPFYRDSKLRVAGTMGVWESPLAFTEYEPIIRPWIEKEVVPCTEDTVLLDDHSIIDHTGVSWNWVITPQPQYISNPNIRNPKVVFGNLGTYDVVLTLTRSGQSFSKTIGNAIQVQKCPSLETCNNPVDIPKNDWKVIHFDSEERNYPGLAAMAIDGDPTTIWHTKWSTGSDPYPHEIIVDMGREYKLFDFVYLPRQDGGKNGRIKDFELYKSSDNVNWDLSFKGSFADNASPKKISLTKGDTARYFRIIALSEVNNNAWASAAEFSFIGCYATPTSSTTDVSPYNFAYPIPSSGPLTIQIPDGEYSITIFDTQGQSKYRNRLSIKAGIYNGDISNLNVGTYILIAESTKGVRYIAKIIKI